MSYSTKAQEGPPVDSLREHVGYDPLTGNLWWQKQKIGRTLFAPFGRGSTTPYIQFGFSRQSLLAHRAAFAIFHGYWPQEVDHVNGNPRDNRIENLREVTRSENTINRKTPRSDNSSGHTGVYFCNSKNRWIAKAKKGDTELLRILKSKDDAIEARADLVIQLYGREFHESVQNTTQNRRRRAS